MLGSFAGLLIGRWAAALPAAAAHRRPPWWCHRRRAPWAAGGRRVLAGVHLHRAVAEAAPPQH